MRVRRKRQVTRSCDWSPPPTHGISVLWRHHQLIVGDPAESGKPVSILAPDGPQSFNYENSKPLFASDGSVHAKYRNLVEYTEDLLFRSTGILFPLEPAQTIARTFPAQPMRDNEEFVATPAWPHTHTLSVNEDQVFLHSTPGWQRLRQSLFPAACSGRKESESLSSTFWSTSQPARPSLELLLPNGAVPTEKCS